MNVLKSSHYLALLLALATGSAHADLVLGFTSAVKDAADMKNEEAAWLPFAEDISRALGTKVTAVGFAKGGDLVAKMKRNEVQLAILGGVPALDAVTQANAQVFAQVVKIKGGESYRSLLIANKASPINSVEDIIKAPKQYSYQSGEPKSTSGTLIPAYYAFAKRSVEPKEIFKKITIGNHDKNLTAVAKRETDVASIASDLFEGKFKEEMAQDYAAVKVIWRSDPINSEPVMYRKDLPQGQKRELERFFLSYGKTAAQKEALKSARQLTGFTRSNNLQLVQVADIQLFQEQQTLMGDDNIPSDKKTEMYQAIFQKYGDLQKLLK